MTTPTATKRQIVACPRCSASVKIHPTTSRIPRHAERGEKGAKDCGFSNDYLPGFVPENPIRASRSRRVA